MASPPPNLVSTSAPGVPGGQLGLSLFPPVTAHLPLGPRWLCLLDHCQSSSRAPVLVGAGWALSSHASGAPVQSAARREWPGMCKHCLRLGICPVFVRRPLVDVTWGVGLSRPTLAFLRGCAHVCAGRAPLTVTACSHAQRNLHPVRPLPFESTGLSQAPARQQAPRRAPGKGLGVGVRSSAVKRRFPPPSFSLSPK